jgi:hypothetical protein
VITASEVEHHQLPRHTVRDFQILKKTGFANGLYSAQQLDRKWEGFEREIVVSLLP